MDSHLLSRWGEVKDELVYSSACAEWREGGVDGDCIGRRSLMVDPEAVVRCEDIDGVYSVTSNHLLGCYTGVGVFVLLILTVFLIRRGTRMGEFHVIVGSAVSQSNV